LNIEIATQVVEFENTTVEFREESFHSTDNVRRFSLVFMSKKKSRKSNCDAISTPQDSVFNSAPVGFASALRIRQWVTA